MPSHSNNMLALINFLIFLFTIPILVVAILQTKIGVTECGLLSFTEFMSIAVVLTTLTLLVFIVNPHISHLKPIFIGYYLAILPGFISSILILTAASFSQSNKEYGVTLIGKQYKEYKLERYPLSARLDLKATTDWEDIKTCILDSKICTGFHNKYLNDNAQDFYQERLNAIESGCCKPPDECGFTYWGPTNWTGENGVYNNSDCSAWQNDPNVLCFDCKSCKAGVTDNRIHSFKKEAAIVVFVFLFLLAIFCVIGICTLENNVAQAQVHPSPSIQLANIVDVLN